MHSGDTQEADVWFTFLAKVSVTTPPKFLVLLAGLVHKYLDPVSVSWKTSIMQAGLIRSALIAISNDGNNMDLCVCHPHPSPLLPLEPRVQKKKCPEPECERALWWWWRADVAGALGLVWGQTLDWRWRVFTESQAFDITHMAVMSHVSIHIVHHRQKYSQILARMSDVHENATVRV